MRAAVPAAGSWRSLGVFVLLCAAAAATGALFPPGAWYASLARPAWTPPDALFPLVWTPLYVAIAVAGWRLWRRCGLEAPVIAWGAQLLLNALWSWIFFGLHRTGLALLELCVLAGAIALTIRLAVRVDRVAAALLAPYLLWVAFAGALNFEIWKLNL
jgi:tryptophan-rich sensory protein